MFFFAVGGCKTINLGEKDEPDGKFIDVLQRNEVVKFKTWAIL